MRRTPDIQYIVDELSVAREKASRRVGILDKIQIPLGKFTMEFIMSCFVITRVARGERYNRFDDLSSDIALRLFPGYRKWVDVFGEERDWRLKSGQGKNRI